MAQLLTPTATLKGGVDAMRMQGFLSDPYREISRPNLRYRQAGWAEVSKFLRGLDAAFIFKYRYYWDDWDLNSHTATLKLNKYITKDFIFSPMYRYYDQTGAKFGGYGDTEFYDPTDYKLLPFGSNTVGLGLTCYLRTFSRNHPTWDFLNNSSVNVQYFRYFNDLMPKHYSANLLATRILFTF